MRVPLAVENDFEGGRQSFRINSNGHWQNVAIPERPYCYARRPYGALPSDATVTPVKKRLFSTLKEETVYRHEFATNLGVDQLNNRFGRSPTDYPWESRVKFQERVAIDFPQYFRDFAHKGPVRPLILDTESKTKQARFQGKHWIGLKLVETGEVVQVDGEDVKQLLPFLAKSDIVVGANVIKYDWNRIIAPLAQTAGVQLPRVVFYDVLRSGFVDQTLHGIKTKDLKSIAKWYGMSSPKEIDRRNTANYPVAELLEYNRSDLEATQLLYEVYGPRLIELADHFGVPLNLMFEEIPSTVPRVSIARGLLRQGIVSDGTNKQRHLELRGRKVRGAAVGIERTGLFTNLVKVDFTQLYPEIIIHFWLGSENTRIVRFIDGLEPFRVEHQEGYWLVYVPDSNLGQTVVIRIGREEEPEVIGILRELGTRREGAKKALKALGLSEAEQQRHPLYAIQWAHKIGRNTYYGYFLSDASEFTDKAQGIVVTGAGRELVLTVVTALKNLGGTVIEWDTDGVYVVGLTTEEVAKASEAAVAQWVGQYLGADIPTFPLSYDEYPQGWFSGMKTYILMDAKGRLIIKGSGLKGSHRPGLEDKVWADAVQKLFAGKSIAPRSYLDWSQYEPYDFIMRRTLGADLDQYESDEDLSVKLAKQYIARGEPIERGMFMEYYKSRTGYRIYLQEEHPPQGLPKDIDYAYYGETRVVKVLKALGVWREREEVCPGLEAGGQVVRRPVYKDGEQLTLGTLGLDQVHPSIVRDSVFPYAAGRDVQNVMTGDWEVCDRCEGQKDILPRGKILPVKCPLCEGEGIIWRAA